MWAVGEVDTTDDEFVVEYYLPIIFNHVKAVHMRYKYTDHKEPQIGPVY